MSDTAIWLLIAFAALMIYMFATADNEYVPVADRPKSREPKRQSINYYGWRGPFFVEDFTNFNAENNPKAEIVPNPEGGECAIPKYNTNVPGVAECHREAMCKCRIPTLTAEESWRNEYHNSVYRLGQCDAYDQTTNNNLSAPNNLKAAQMKSCMGDVFDPADKVSPWCYANAMKQCSF